MVLKGYRREFREVNVCSVCVLLGRKKSSEEYVTTSMCWGGGGDKIYVLLLSPQHMYMLHFGELNAYNAAKITIRQYLREYFN